MCDRVWIGGAEFGILSPVVRSDVSIEVSEGWEAEESPGKVESDFNFSPEARSSPPDNMRSS
jgi:hypothetical protein